MELHFSSKSLEKQLTQDRLMKSKFGDCYSKLRLRMNELDAVESLAEISEYPPQRKHVLSGDLSGCFAVDVSRNRRIIFEPFPKSIPYKDDGNIRYEAIKSIKILDVRDYHD
jgi:proteic killer suppression protein